MKMKPTTPPPANRSKPSVLKELRVIPGVGERIAEVLWNLGIRSVAGLRDENPEALYERFCQLLGRKADRCLLYVFRCAVNFASHEDCDPELLKWWNWKDGVAGMTKKSQKAKVTCT
ncbi:MAG: helix-hairpin-helix domain-containing protein [Candidatus Omnitrophota bacterium]